MVFTTATQTFAQADERRRLEQSQQQGQQRMAQLQQELGQLQTDFQAGRITMDQFQRRVTEIQTELQNINNQVGTAQQQYFESGARFTQAQIQRIETLLDQDKNLQAQFHNGQINEANYTRQINSVRNELHQITTPFQDSPAAASQYQEIEKRIERIWPGVQPGWPTAQQWNEVIRHYGYGPFTQSRGTKASFTMDDTFFQISNQPDVVFREMKNQIERITRGKVLKVNENNDNIYSIDVQSPNPRLDSSDGTFYIISISLRIMDNAVIFNIGDLWENIRNYQ